MIIAVIKEIPFKITSPTIRSTETTRVVRSVATTITLTCITPDIKYEMKMNDEKVVQRIILFEDPP